MIELTDMNNLKMCGDESLLRFEIAQILVSYQYILDSVDKVETRSGMRLIDTLAEILMIALELYGDDEYMKMLEHSTSNVVDMTDLIGVLKKIKNES